MTDSRYPYTYSCDYIRMFGPVNSEGVVLSRADASAIRKGIAQALGIPDIELANALANAQLKNEDSPEILQEQTQRLMRALGFNTEATK